MTGEAENAIGATAGQQQQQQQQTAQQGSQASSSTSRAINGDKYSNASLGVGSPPSTSQAGPSSTGVAARPQAGVSRAPSTTLSSNPVSDSASNSEASAAPSSKRNPLSRGMSTRSGSGKSFFGKKASTSQVQTVASLAAAAAANRRPGTAASDNSGTTDSDNAPGGSSSANGASQGNSLASSGSQDASSSNNGVPVTQGTLPTSSHAPAAASKPTTSIPLNLTQRPDPSSTLFTTLSELFNVITNQPKQSGVVAPQAFITQLKQENELFRSTMHQDAHEFFNYLMNEVSEDVLRRESDLQREMRKPSFAPSPPLRSVS